jgi:hypothetical protein
VAAECDEPTQLVRPRPLADDEPTPHGRVFEDDEPTVPRLLRELSDELADDLDDELLDAPTAPHPPGLADEPTAPRRTRSLADEPTAPRPHRFTGEVTERLAFSRPDTPPPPVPVTPPLAIRTGELSHPLTEEAPPAPTPRRGLRLLAAGLGSTAVAGALFGAAVWMSPSDADDWLTRASASVSALVGAVLGDAPPPAGIEPR